MIVISMCLKSQITHMVGGGVKIHCSYTESLVFYVLLRLRLRYLPRLNRKASKEKRDRKFLLTLQ